MSRRFNDPEPVCCAVCKRQASGFGYMGPQRRAPVAWFCQDPDCMILGKVVYHMASRELSQVEAFSLAEAGDEAGAYLQRIEKFDLASLSREEWLHFLKLVLTSYETRMRDRLLGQAVSAR